MIGADCNWPGDSPCNRPDCSNCRPACRHDDGVLVEVNGELECAACVDAERARDERNDDNFMRGGPYRAGAWDLRRVNS